MDILDFVISTRMMALAACITSAGALLAACATFLLVVIREVRRN